MAVMRWDTESQAFVETNEVPMRYDPASEAWTGTSGKAYDVTMEAWEEKWNPVKPLFLIQDGEMQVGFNIVGLRQVDNSYHGYPTGANITTNSNGVCFSIGGSTNTGACGGACTVNSYDITKYKKLCLNVVNAFGKAGCYKGGILTKGNPTGNNSAGTWSVSRTSEDEVPYSGNYKGFLYYDGCSGATNFYTEYGIEDVTGTYPILLASWNTYVFPSYVTIKDAWLE